MRSMNSFDDRWVVTGACCLITRLINENTFSIGLHSGQYGGAYKIDNPLERIKFLTRLDLWNAILSMMATLPFGYFGSV